MGNHAVCSPTGGERRRICWKTKCFSKFTANSRLWSGVRGPSPYMQPPGSHPPPPRKVVSKKQHAFFPGNTQNPKFRVLILRGSREISTFSQIPGPNFRIPGPDSERTALFWNRGPKFKVFLTISRHFRKLSTSLGLFLTTNETWPGCCTGGEAGERFSHKND